MPRRPPRKPDPRLDLSALVRQAGCRTVQDAVDHLLLRFMSVPVDADTLAALLRRIADALNADGIASPGGASWHPGNVQRALARIAA